MGQEWGSLLIKYFEFEPFMSFPNEIDLQKFGNKKMEPLSGVISLTLKPMVESVGEAGFSRRLGFTVAVTVVAAVVCACTAAAAPTASQHFVLVHRLCSKCFPCIYLCVRFYSQLL